MDDHKTNRIILQETLKRWKMKPILASSGAEALEKIGAAAGGENAIQLILLDVMMPEMDGDEVARRVKERWGDKAPAILHLSSAGRLMSEKELAELGVARALTKPLKPSELHEAIIQLFIFSESTGAEDGEAARVRTADSASLKLLLAEDGHVNQLVATRLLEDRGHQVVLANNGRKAIEALSREAFDAVLMDVQMPELDGYEATRAIRLSEKETGAHIPIIAMTANAMSGDREKCLESGMDDYIAKPVRIEDLMVVLKRLVKPPTGGA